MNLLGVILEELVLLLSADRPRWLSHIALRVFAADDEAHLSAGICWDRGPGVFGDGKDLLASFAEWEDYVHVEPWVLACVMLSVSCM